MPENKTGIQENVSLHCVQNNQRDGRKNYETQKTPVQCSTGSKKYWELRQLVEWHEEFRESNLHFFNEKTFTVDSFFNKQNQVRSGYNVWECLWKPQSVNNQASSLNHDDWSRSIERGKDPLAWFEQGCRLRTKKVLRLKFIHGLRS